MAATLHQRQLWTARLLVGAVLAMNVQSALVFWLNPQAFAPAYEMAGIPGQAAMRGFAVLFLMWNVPYVLATWHPRRFRISLYEAVAMQTIGLIGESLIYGSLPAGHATLQASILRFIVFDGAGLAALLLATWVMRRTDPLRCADHRDKKCTLD